MDNYLLKGGGVATDSQMANLSGAVRGRERQFLLNKSRLARWRNSYLTLRSNQIETRRSRAWSLVYFNYSTTFFDYACCP